MKKNFPGTNPAQLPSQSPADATTPQRGKLKIYLGYAAGVGKTQAMLTAACRRRLEGVDVVVGYVNTHNQPETESQLAGFEIIFPKEIEYRGFFLPEMDVDSILTRHPALVLVDDLAHTNTPGLRHPKRYQDILELLDAGIDIYTTVNIQHLESLNDVVAQITGWKVHETIPDKIIDEANDIELIDLPVDELIKRFNEGKVTIPEQETFTFERFFRKGNLTALREMTLRRTAEQVDNRMRAYMRESDISGPWPAAERILVCIGPDEFGEHIIRSARRLADELKAEWFALFVETPTHTRLGQEKRDQITRSLQLAEDLGARTKILPASSSIKSIAQAIMDYARKHNVTKIVSGKPIHPRWFDLLRGSLVDELLHRSGDIDIYIISNSAPTRILPEENPLRLHTSWRKYVWGAVLVALATGLGFLVKLDISPTNLVMIYLLVVVVAALYLGRGPAILVSILGVGAFDFFFIPPYYTLVVSQSEYIITFIGLFLVGVVISALAVRAREQAESAQQREADTARLYALSRDLAAADGLDMVVKAARTHLEADFGREVVIYIPEGDNLHPYRETESYHPVPDDEESKLAVWSYQHAEPAGLGTSTLPTAEPYFIPLNTSSHTVGVLSLKPLDLTSKFTSDQHRMLEAFANQTAQAIERANLAEQTRQIKLLQTAEKLQNALLNSISHDLRTPLVSITGALTTLEAQGDSLVPNIRQSLVETAREEADRLNRLVGNLLDMTRLEGGALKVKRELADVQDIIGTSIGQMETRLEARSIQAAWLDPIPFVNLDFVLIVHVLNNLLDNAIKYSPEGSPIEVQARMTGEEVQISVMDRGLGIPVEDLERVFDKFYRVQRPAQAAGTGLGLAICKGIIEAHGGHIWAENREGGGTIIKVALPIP